MKFKILEFLKKQNDFVSSEEIKKVFNISLEDISKNILKLKNLGYDILSQPDKGYLFKNSFNDTMNDYEIKTSLKTKSFAKDFLFLEEVDSTNNEAKVQAQNGVCDGFLVISEKQTKGKGRLGNSWIHSQNENLAFSLVLKPTILPNEIMPLTLITGIAICKALRKLEIPAFLKWPNDIVINGKKAVGILTELSCEAEKINFLIVGIGINVNTKVFDESIEHKATSLFLETQKNFNRLQVLNAILVEFENIYFEFLKSGSFKPFVKEYKSICLNIGKKINATSKQKTITGTATGISENGELIVKNNENDTVSILSGEVSVRLENGNYI